MRHDRSPPGRGHDQANPSPAPRRRDFTVVCRNQPLTITAGVYDDGMVGEVFITTAKSGADLQNIANDAAAICLAVHCINVNIDVIRHAVTRCNEARRPLSRTVWWSICLPACDARLVVMNPGDGGPRHDSRIT